ncbi:hypothetical protein LTR10_013773 [Elasticomyces elasticus]|uniref:Inhibitor I9 domain-containing protein n=1 Tax=Exophiala sideris TaxID=1016849 RepID=A0ABR0JGF3_9EURO|nr:hypothetical protein LTR10_013773 [Elasticomyces elasticus]KAK5033251.1 hypothetical protein LTS07_003552 [Exophiala sideris]KAK5042252.1 hypothetical protein LTR13_002058 [Exophiala sideris]KAK5063795.1 hypothetical protein LTR69_003560 [Exophiala sideris]KAK5185520.1 hypothetical protein LTR44_002509 [Eurotiomycetes sp. CCFEE 6388]
MRFSIIALLAFIAFVLAVPPNQKPVVVSYPADTPSSVIDQAIAEIIKDGGIITHEYSLIKGFAAKVAEATLEKITTLADTYAPQIEEDFVVRIDGSTDTQEQ